MTSRALPTMGRRPAPEPKPDTGGPGRAAHPVLLGVLLGVAWAAAMRGYMIQLAGPASVFSWLGTFGAVLLPGAAVGGLLGWAEHRRRRGVGRGRPWLAASPLLLAVVPLLLPGAVTALVTTGLGSGAIGMTLLGVLGGSALSGRGRRGLRVCGGLVAFSLVPAAFLAPPMRPELDPSQPLGAWAATTFAALFLCLALACAIPLRRPVAPVEVS